MEPQKKIQPFQVIWLAAAVLVLFGLLVPPVLGIAGGAEQFEVLTHVGLYGEGAAVGGSYGYTAPAGAQGFYEHFLAMLAFLCRPIGVFPIQVLGVVYGGVFLAALYVMMKYTRRTQKWVSVVTALAAVVMFCDLGYIAYCNSFYRDGLSFVLTFALGATVLSLRHRADWRKILLLSLLAAGFVFVRVLNAIAGLGLAFALVWAVVLPGDKRLKITAWVCGGVVLAASVVSFFTTPVPIEQQSKFNAVYYGALKDGDAAHGAVLGVSPEFAGKSYFDVAEADQTAADRVTYGDIAGFYVSHPGALLREVKIAANNAAFLTQGYLSYQQAGAELGIKHAFVLRIWSYLKRTVLPQGLWVILAFCIGYLAVCVANARKYCLAGERGAAFLAGVLAVLPAGALAELFGTVILTGEAAISRNLFCFGLLYDLMLFSTLVWGIATVTERRQAMKTKYGVNQ